MPFCGSCGAQVEGRFCAKCGTPAQVASGAEPAVAPAMAAVPGAVPPAAAFQAVPQPAAQPMADNIASMLCYILGFVTGIIFLVLEPYNRNRAIRFHAFQSIFLWVAFFGVWIVLQVVASMLVAIHLWSLLPVIGLIGTVIWLGSMVLAIVLMVKAYQGQALVLPVIGPLAQKQA